VQKTRSDALTSASSVIPMHPVVLSGCQITSGNVSVCLKSDANLYGEVVMPKSAVVLLEVNCPVCGESVGKLELKLDHLEYSYSGRSNNAWRISERKVDQGHVYATASASETFDHACKLVVIKPDHERNSDTGAAPQGITDELTRLRELEADVTRRLTDDVGKVQKVTGPGSALEQIQVDQMIERGECVRGTTDMPGKSDGCLTHHQPWPCQHSDDFKNSIDQAARERKSSGAKMDPIGVRLPGRSL